MKPTLNALLGSITLNIKEVWSPRDPNKCTSAELVVVSDLRRFFFHMLMKDNQFRCVCIFESNSVFVANQYTSQQLIPTLQSHIDQNPEFVHFLQDVLITFFKTTNHLRIIESYKNSLNLGELITYFKKECYRDQDLRLFKIIYERSKC